MKHKSDHVILLAKTFLWLSIIFRLKPRLLVLVHKGLTYQQALTGCDFSRPLPLSCPPNCSTSKPSQDVTSRALCLSLAHLTVPTSKSSQEVTSRTLCLSLAHLTVPTSGPLHQLLPLFAGPLPWFLMRLDPFSLNILPQKDFPHHSSSLQSEVASQSFFFRTFT